MNAAETTRQRAIAARPVTVLALGLIALLSAACSEAPSEQTGVRAVVLPYLTHLPFHIAREEGLFENQGLDVEFVRMGRQQDTMSALARGEVDVAAGMLTIHEIALAVADYPVRVVAALGEQHPDSCPFVAVLARNEHFESGALDRPEELRKLRFDVAPTLPLAFLVDRALGEYGLDLRDVTLEDIPPPAALEALAVGAIDVTVDSEPFVSRHLQRGRAGIWRTMGELMPGFVSSVMIYGPTMIEDPETGEGFATAILQAMDRLREGKTVRNLDIAERALGLSRAEVAGACWPVVPVTGEIDPAVFHEYEQWSLEQQLIGRVPDDDALFDPHFMRVANDRLGRS